MSSLSHRSRGFALILLLVILILGALAGIVSRLAQVEPQNTIDRDIKTAAALRTARDALIAWSARHATRPGALPCPDINGDGVADVPCNAAAQRVGRIPWQTLGIASPLDSTGERLWYAVSAPLSDQLAAPPPPVLNAFTLGDLNLCQTTAAPCPGAALIANQLVAIVIAPGAPIAGQSRTPANQNDPTQFLEGRNAVVADTEFDTGNRSPVFNDTTLPITGKELFDIVGASVAANIRATVVPQITALPPPAPVVPAAPYDPTGADPQKWAGLPFALPFQDPRGAWPAVPAVGAPVTTGLLPAQWPPAPPPPPLAYGGPTIVPPVPNGVQSAFCGPSGPNWQCNLNLRAPPNDCPVGSAVFCRFRVDVVNAGKALLGPLPVLAAPPIPGGATGVLALSIRGQVVPIGDPFGGAGNARVTVQFQMGAPSPTATITLAPPARNDLSALPPWFVQNEWFRNVYYAVAAADWGAGQCVAGANCLSIRYPDQQIVPNLNGVLLIMGSPFAPVPAVNPACVPLPLEATFLEGPNVTTWPAGPPTCPATTPQTFESSVPRTDFNDKVVAVSP